MFFFLECHYLTFHWILPRNPLGPFFLPSPSNLSEQYPKSMVPGPIAPIYFLKPLSPLTTHPPAQAAQPGDSHMRVHCPNLAWTVSRIFNCLLRSNFALKSLEVLQTCLPPQLTDPPPPGWPQKMSQPSFTLLPLGAVDTKSRPLDFRNLSAAAVNQGLLRRPSLARAVTEWAPSLSPASDFSPFTSLLHTTSKGNVVQFNLVRSLPWKKPTWAFRVLLQLSPGHLSSFSSIHRAQSALSTPQSPQVLSTAHLRSFAFPIHSSRDPWTQTPTHLRSQIENLPWKFSWLPFSQHLS